MNSFGLKWIAALAASAVASAAGALPVNATVVVVWNAAALAEVRLARLGPPIVARALAVAHTCMYDAWAPYDSRAIASTASTPRRPLVEQNDTNKATAISFAAYRCLVNLFPAGTPRLDAVMRSLGHEPLDTTTSLATAQGIGNAAAAAVIAARRNDGANQYGDLHAGAYSDYTGYASLNSPMPFCLPSTPTACPLNISNPYHWQPLTNNLRVTQVFAAAHWGNVYPFALSSGAQFDNLPEVNAGPKYLEGPGKYMEDINAILSYSSNLTAQQKLIIEYWADGPNSELPPGHWSLFAQYVSERDNHSIDKDVKMFFAMQNASLDAGIVAWHMKRRFDGVRPITGIRYFKQGVQLLAWGGPGRPIEYIDGGKWTPYNPGSNLTPAFPGYLSGHSTFSAASATVLRSFTGSDTFGFATIVPPNFGRVEPGVPAVPTTMSYLTFTAAVNEAGLSRLYAGIHFPDDNDDGQLLGNLAGQQAWAKSQGLFNGGLPAATYDYGSDVTCQNVTLGEQTYRNIWIPVGARCLLLGTHATGNLVLGPGASVDSSNATIDGSLMGVILGDVQVTGGRIGGSVQVAQSQTLTLSGTSVGGSVQLAANAGTLDLQDLRVTRDIQLFYNRGAASINRNVAGGNLQCTRNQFTPTGSGNVALSKEDQCQGL